MEFKKKILDNGLTIIGEMNPSAQSVAIGFFVKTGARDESQDVSGVSHFLEHMLFKGTEELSALQVNEAFDRTGAKFNAFTSEENTVYYAAVLPEYLTDVTQLWCKLMRPSLRDDDFNLEKNVIKEEIAMYKDMPNFDVMDKCRALHFDGHPCGNSVLGSDSSIDQLQATQMREYFNRRYAPNNITVTCCGQFDFAQLCEIVEANCADWTAAEDDRETTFFDGTNQTKKETKATLVREHICLMTKAVSFQDKRSYAGGLLSIILGDDVGSRFFWALVDTALAEAASMHFEAMDGTGAFYTYIRTGAETADKVMNIVRDLFADIEKNGISEDELLKAKNKILSTVTIKNEVPMGRLIDLGFNWTYLKEYRPIAKEIELIKAVTLNDICSLINELKLSEFTQLSLSPDK